MSRLEAPRGSPSRLMYGLAATCSSVMPLASTNNASRNSGYDGTLAAGKNASAPMAAMISPMTTLGLYPTCAMTRPAGSDITR